MIYLALDASTRAVGWALFRDDALLDSGVYVPQGDDWWVRVASFAQWLDIQLHICGGMDIAYEIARGDHGNTHTDRVLGALEYVARIAAEEYERVFTGVNPMQVKATQCHKNNLELARQIKGAPLDKDNPGDEADAIGAGYAAWGKIKEAAWARQ